jgi:Secretion system C-terminal sorting domain
MFEYSPVRSVAFGRTNDAVLTPQPVRDQLNVELTEAFDSDANWQVFDFAGRLVQSGTLTGESKTFTADMTALTDGNYVLRIANGEAVITKQFQKK